MPPGSPLTPHHLRAMLLALLLAALLSVGLPTTAARAALATPSDLTPHAVAVDGIPTLAWTRVTGAASYSVQISTSAGFETKLWTISTVNRQAVPSRQLPSGVLYWRVRAVAGTEAGSWATAQFERDPVAGPTPVLPVSETVLDQPEEPALVSWTRVNGATGYALEVSTEASFTVAAAKKTYETKNTSFVVPDPRPGQTYHWRVRAVLDAGVTTEWSSTSEYQIGGLAKAALQSPADSASVGVEDVVLDWEPVLGAKTYNVQVSGDAAFGALDLEVDATGIVSTRFSPATTLADGQYYWRVQPVDASGHKPDWAAVDTWTFRRHWPDQPALEHPADGAVVTDPFFFQWTPVHLASEYVVQLSTTPDFASYDSCTTTNTTFVPTQRSDCFPTATGVSYWRVIGVDAPGRTADNEPITTDPSVAEVGQFVYLPGSPDLLSPTDGATVAVPTLEWMPVEGAESYKVTISPTGSGSGGGTFTTTGTSFTPRTRLTVGQSYRWQVQTVSASGRLGTGVPAAGQPVFTAGTPSATTFSTPEPTGVSDPSSRFPTLSWRPTTGATSYRILVRPTGTLAWTALADRFSYPAGEDDTSTWLTAGTYDWKVDAYNGLALLTSSTGTSTFTVTALAAVTGEHVAMVGTALEPDTSCDAQLPLQCTRLGHTPVLSWDNQPDAASYKVWLARDAALTDVVSGYPARVEGHVFTPTAALPDNQPGAAYYWFVQPCTTTTKCGAKTQAGHAFAKLSKPIQTTSPSPGQQRANDVTFTWRDYLETNQDPDAFPVADPGNVHSVSPRTEAARYRVQVSTSSDFDTLVETSAVLVDQTSYTASTTTYPEGPLYWRVQAVDGSGNSLAFSPAVQFVKASPAVTLTEPLNDVELSDSPAFRWEPLAFAASYDFEIYRNGDTTGSTANLVFSGTSKQAAGTTETPLPVSSTPYTWRVRPVDAKGRPGPWTDLADPAARFVRTGGSPIQLAPAEGAFVQSAGGLFTWEPLTGATSYRVERRLTTTITGAVTPAHAWAPTAALTSGSWEWRVRALDTGGKIIGSSPWRVFIVDAIRPTVTTYGPKSTVARDSDFAIRFSEPVESVDETTFKIVVGGTTTALPATVTLNATGTRAVLDPSANLQARRQYTVHATSDIHDAAGNRLRKRSWTVTAS